MEILKMKEIENFFGDSIIPEAIKNGEIEAIILIHPKDTCPTYDLRDRIILHTPRLLARDLNLKIGESVSIFLDGRIESDKNLSNIQKNRVREFLNVPTEKIDSEDFTDDLNLIFEDEKNFDFSKVKIYPDGEIEYRGTRTNLYVGLPYIY